MITYEVKEPPISGVLNRRDRQEVICFICSHSSNCHFFLNEDGALYCPVTSGRTAMSFSVRRETRVESKFDWLPFFSKTTITPNDSIYPAKRNIARYCE